MLLDEFGHAPFTKKDSHDSSAGSEVFANVPFSTVSKPYRNDEDLFGCTPFGGVASVPPMEMTADLPVEDARQYNPFDDAPFGSSGQVTSAPGKDPFGATPFTVCFMRVLTESNPVGRHHRFRH